MSVKPIMSDGAELGQSDMLHVGAGIVLKGTTTGGSSASGTVLLYADPDGTLWQKDDTGTDTQLA